MVEYCDNCGKVKIMTFCPRCEKRVVPNRGIEQAVCNNCGLTIKMCMCRSKNKIR